MSHRTYSIDSSALLDGWVRHYPPEHFPSLWDRVRALIGEGRFLVSEEVFVEINEHDDSLSAWLNARQDQVVVPTTGEVAGVVRQILAAHERLAMSGPGRNRADPFVIAVANIRSATVVTGEKGGTPNRPKIPSVCAALDIRCIGLLELIQIEGWVFS